MGVGFSRMTGLAGGFAALLAVGGCAPIPELGALLQPRSVLPAPSAPVVTPAPQDAWWHAYGDAQLDQLMDLAFAQSPDLEVAVAQLHRAQGASISAGAGLLPDVSGSASASKLRQSYNNGVDPAFVPHGFQDSARASVDFSYELDFFGRNRDALIAAQGRERAAALEVAQARVVLAAGVAGKYAELVQLYAERDAARQTVEVQSKTVGLFQKRKSGGLENSGAVDEAQAALAAAQADVAGLDESIARTRNALAELTGQGPDAAARMTRPAVSVLHAYGTPAALPVDLVARRPDVMAAQARVEAAAKQVHVAKAGFYPNIDLVGYLGHQSLGVDTFFKSGSLIGQFGPAIHLPLFDAGTIEGAYRTARADYEDAVASYEQTVLAALREAADALASQKALEARAKSTQAALAASIRAYDVAQDRYRGGLGNYLEVLHAQEAVTANRRAQAVIATRAFVLDVALIKAVGGSTYSETTSTNGQSQ